ncbi:fibronectin type III domain-containing protein [Mesobacillus subterraneus]|uniref:fibronectin type III domain-containing protein n=1 Tax=Mesobacillus subterraneus TaxID=285983 RepID=UPI00273D5CAF|nr:fibronectin type III domain-containing protein [Mesobacillus subterraneus]WLR54370.1 fibronectin type III domain-containing protein [Mesobacillus subterraneus]
MIAAKIVALWYLLILSGSYLSADTGAYFNDVETISEKIGAAENYCADPDWAKEHHQYCKDNAGLGNGCEAGDDCDSEKGEDEDNPGHNRESCGDHTSAPCSEGSKITNIKISQTSNTITLTWTNPNDNKFKSIKIYRDQEPAPISENITNGQFEDAGLSPNTKYTYYIVEVNKKGENLGTAIFEATTSSVEETEKPKSEEKSTEPEEDINVPEEETKKTEEDKQPPDEVTNAQASEIGNSGKVEFYWVTPANQDFSHIRIYRDNELIADNLKTNMYTEQVTDKNHIYKVTTVDTSGNESPGLPIEVTWHK